jgi:hypothetical protein
MKLQVDVSEKAYETLLERAPTKDSKGVEKVAAKVVERFSDVPDSDRILVLRAPTRRALEAIFQTTVDSPEDLIQKVSKLSSLGLGPVTRALTAGESIALTEQARFHGFSVEEWYNTVCNQIIEELLGRV